ncbi:flagellar basal-body rod protein FlgF [Cellvibrio zantedeschiae]|uniref:Flagellar basal-body rod protein FlgF n=1 Tax=Cellvibrio zantedeschiae TaxID=1237077 RepID=A0ABQ3BBY4_9GAMM|nr:flagellar hook basal-body protein [Cellvibrio zantedeschiae]GGY84983.1 flagellar basal-body rod protein FlgF [Cellvibrio zantedeschiae]
MTDPIMAYAGVMRVEIERMNSIAHNSSNVNSDGFLQEKTYLDGNQFKKILLNQKIDNSYSVAPDKKLGALRLTQSSNDIGINSGDWFQVESDEGTFLTRNGHFNLDEAGTLCLGKYKVVGTNGYITALKPGFTVHSDGSVFSGGEYVDKLKMISLPENFTLSPAGNGVYLSPSDAKEATDPKVVQGALVASNVDIQSDMTKIIEISRHIEMLQRAMTAYSSVLDVGINQIGK